MDIINKGLKKASKKFSLMMAPIRKKKLSKQEFTIISNNCWAGDVYRYFDLPYQTPTVGLYFWADDYIRFLTNLKYYLSCELVFITVEESKYKDILIKKNQSDRVLARLDDVELVFLHYSSKQEALEKWVRRVQRVNFDNLIIKFSRQNCFEDKHLKMFAELPYTKKIFFDNQKNDYDFSVYIPGFENLDFLPDDITTYRKYMNITHWINK
jgi:uncharacterized protein (DUF1919 family)